MRDRYPTDQLHILVAQRNSANYTYDGIEVGGERLAQEIEDELVELEERGNRITKISFVGYSLGGIIARYCIGLFFSRGLFDKLRPVNFTAFASPFLGVRVPNRGYHSGIYNALASHMLSASGRQLFLVDTYRDSGQALLEVMTDPNSIFITGLERFEKRALYANIVNDFFAPWFTTNFTRTDPFVDLDAVQLNYMKGYDSVLLDPARPVQWKTLEEPGVWVAIYNWGRSFASKLPYYGLLGITMPIALTALAINSGIQTVRSHQRVQLHNSNKAGIFKSDRNPYLLDSALKTLATAEPHTYLSEFETSSVSARLMELKEDSSTSTGATGPSESRAEDQLGVKQASEFPALALDPRQERMIDVLSTLGIRKYPVYISKAHHSHAAIIVRKNGKNMHEGYVVLQHWLDHEFQI